MPIPTIPENFLCKINHTIMFNPVLAEDGYNYEKEAIEHWLEEHDTSPMTRETIGNKLISNKDLKSDIMGFLDRNIDVFYEAVVTSTPEQDNSELISALINHSGLEVQSIKCGINA